MSQLKLDTNDPRSGRLITTDDLNKMGLDLQLMLNSTSNNTLRCPDAWAQGNTDSAFACNNFVGVQRSHRANDYNYGWVDFSAERGLYIYTPGEAYLMQQITQPATDVCEIATIPVTNTSSDSVTVTETYQEETTQSARILDSWSSTVTFKAQFKMFDQGFELEGSLQKGNESETTKATTKTSSVAIQITAPPNSSSSLHVTRTTTKQTVMYGLDLLIGSDNPGGSIGKATQNQSTWDRWFRWEDLFPDHVKQYCEVHGPNDPYCDKCRTSSERQQTAPRHKASQSEYCQLNTSIHLPCYVGLLFSYLLCQIKACCCPVSGLSLYQNAIHVTFLTKTSTRIFTRKLSLLDVCIRGLIMNIRQ